MTANASILYKTSNSAFGKAVEDGHKHEAPVHGRSGKFSIVSILVPLI